MATAAPNWWENDPVAHSPAPAPPAAPYVVGTPRPSPPPSGYRPQGAGLAPIPGGPADPTRTPPAGYRYKADGSLEAIPGGPADPDRNAGTLSGNRALTGAEYAASIPDPARRAQAQALVEGRIPWPTGRASADPHWQQIIADASQIDPTLDASTAARRRAAITQFTGNGLAAQRIGSANRLAHHLDDLNRASEAMVGPNTGFTPANTMLAAAGQLFEPTDRATYDAAVGQVANELERFFRGAGGSEHDVARIISNLSRWQSLDERRAAIREAISLIHGGIGPLQNQYNDAFQQGTARPQITWVDPDAQRIYRDIGGADFSLPGATPPAAGPGQPPGGPSPPDGSPGPPTGPQAREGEPSGLVVDIWPGGPPPRDRSHANAAWQNAFQRASTREPGLTWDAFIARNLVPDPQAAPPPDISGARGGSPEAQQRAMMENQISASVPLVGPLVQADQAFRGPEAANALLHGGQDWATFGTRDEMSAGLNALLGRGSYDQNVNFERGVDAYDTQHNFGDRLTGQIVTGLPEALLPGGIPAQMARGGAQGALYGFGSGEGDFSQRAPNALLGGVIGVAAPPALAVLGRGAGRAVNALRGAPANAERRAVIEAANRQNVSLMRADTGGVGTRMAAGVTGRTFGGIPLANAARRSAASAGAAVDRVAADMGTVADPAGAGQAAQRGMRRFLETSRVRGDEIRNNIPIPPAQPAQTSGAVAALSERTTGMTSNPLLSEMFKEPRLQGYLAALQGRAAEVPTGVLDAQGREITRTVQEGGGLSWQDLRNFRSRVGEMIERPPVAGEDNSIVALRHLYAGLSQDMEATARQVSPRALTMVRRSIQYDRGRAARREGVISDILGRDFGNGAEQAFQRINSWAQERGGNFANVARTLRSMPPEEANTVRASIFARMGDASAARQDVGAAMAAQQGEHAPLFSPAEFSRQWNLMSDRAKMFLIPNARHRADLNDLALITSAQKRASEFQNYSNTSLAANAMGFMAGLQASPIAAVTYALGSYGAGRFLASPPAARWLAQAARMQSQQSLRSHVGRLASLAARDPAIAQELLSLRQAILTGANDNVSAVSRAAASSGADPNGNQQNQ